MIVDITVPELGESISEVEIGEWAVKVGEKIERDEAVVDVESEKATVDVPAPRTGLLVEILKKQGETAAIGEVIGRIDTEEGGTGGGEEAEGTPEAKGEEKAGHDAEEDEAAGADTAGEKKVMPAAARVMAEHRLDETQVKPTGPGGRILKEDAQRAAAAVKRSDRDESASAPPRPADEPEPSAGERRVRMSPLRRAIAERLVSASRDMALLTTFNEADMSEIKRLRASLGAEFAEKHEVRLGFMSFFVKASVAALKDFPLVNARLDGEEIVYRDQCDIGVAIGGGKGLVVPVLRRAERLGFAEIEQQIARFAKRAKENALTMEELEGGTFTISNGGVYGSMLSTPIVNPPQSAILGLHAIKDRPVAVDGEVRIRPMMYLALSYDHRIIDGREAVSFLKSIKERIEAPHKLLLEI